MAKSSKSFFNSESGNAVVVAFDYGITGAVHQEAKNPRATMEKFMAGEPEGVLLSPILIHRFADVFEKYPTVAPIASLDSIVRNPNLTGPVQLFDFDTAIRMGARGVKSLLILGQTDGILLLQNMQRASHLADLAFKQGVPLMLEVVFWGPQIPPEKQNDPDLIYSGCRLGLELGADSIKTTYTGDAKSFKDITSSLPIPILILGGSKSPNTENVFQSVMDAMDAGARGVVFGRNIYQHESPEGMVKALKALVHNGISAGEAIRITKT
jgi:DhnA family fructose-bisphosphate aldolase class Ia